MSKFVRCMKYEDVHSGSGKADLIFLAMTAIKYVQTVRGVGSIATDYDGSRYYCVADNAPPWDNGDFKDCIVEL